MLSNTILAKICNQNTRGTMFGFNSVFGSIGILILEGIGGHLYENVSRQGPFLFGYFSYVVFTIVTFCLGIAGKLRI